MSSPAITAASPVIAVDTKRKPSAVLGFMAGGIAACGAVTLTNPAEVCTIFNMSPGSLGSPKRKFCMTCPPTTNEHEFFFAKNRSSKLGFNFRES